MRHFVLRRRKADATRAAADNHANDAVIRERISRSMRRRMSDDLVNLIRRACLSGHAEAAKGLWVVLRELSDREARERLRHGRPPDEALLEALAIEIATAVRSKQSTR